MSKNAISAPEWDGVVKSYVRYRTGGGRLNEQSKEEKEVLPALQG